MAKEKATERKVYCPVFASEDAKFEENSYTNRVELTMWTGFNPNLVKKMLDKGKDKVYLPINMTRTAAKELIRILEEKLGE